MSAVIISCRESAEVKGTDNLSRYVVDLDGDLRLGVEVKRNEGLGIERVGIVLQQAQRFGAECHDANGHFNRTAKSELRMRKL